MTVLYDDVCSIKINDNNKNNYLAYQMSILTFLNIIVPFRHPMDKKCVKVS